jgi:hypothetical protein
VSAGNGCPYESREDEHPHKVRLFRCLINTSSCCWCLARCPHGSVVNDGSLAATLECSHKVLSLDVFSKRAHKVRSLAATQVCSHKVLSLDVFSKRAHKVRSLAATLECSHKVLSLDVFSKRAHKVRSLFGWLCLRLALTLCVHRTCATCWLPCRPLPSLCVHTC